jgi:hypothetical protein
LIDPKVAKEAEITDESIIQSGSASESQVAAISAVTVNKEEPWTGTWKVKGGRGGDFVLKLKQSGNKVKATRGSQVNMKAKVKRDRLKGWYGSTQYPIDIDFKISKDCKSFKGTGFNNTFGTSYLKGERIEPNKAMEVITHKEKTDKSIIQSDSTSGTQVAAIPEVYKKEPWSGTWKVKGSPWGDMYFKLKQNGIKVYSIRGSTNEVKAKVKGDRLKGWYEGSAGIYTQINLRIAKDGKTFKGTEFSTYSKNTILEGERQE